MTWEEFFAYVSTPYDPSSPATPLAGMSQAQTDALRLQCTIIKVDAAVAADLRFWLRTFLRAAEHSALAGRIFDHYLYGTGGDYRLSVRDVRDLALHGSITPWDLRRAAYNAAGPREEWIELESAYQRQPTRIRRYHGRYQAATENGAMAKYAVRFEGVFGDLPISPNLTRACSVTMWQGFVRIYDRFDLNPHWGWSPSNNYGRSAAGEQQTRIGYILNLGHDFDIVSPEIFSWQARRGTHVNVTNMKLAEYRRNRARLMQEEARAGAASR